ncbi:hypothetical protein H0H92_000637, partial [Tricholoma furcatifolium]
MQSLSDVIAFNDKHPELEKPEGFEDQTMYVHVSTPHPINTISSLAGYPIVTVPLGLFSDYVTPIPEGPLTFYPAPGVPFYLSFWGTAYSDFDLAGFVNAYEQRTKTRLARKAYTTAIVTSTLMPRDNACAANVDPGNKTGINAVEDPFRDGWVYMNNAWSGLTLSAISRERGVLEE